MEPIVITNRYRLGILAAAVIAAVASATPRAQMDYGPKVAKTYGQGLPRDKDKLIFTDDQYPVWPLTPAQQQYAPINGARMKQHVVDLANVAIKYATRDTSGGAACRARAPTRRGWDT